MSLTARMSYLQNAWDRAEREHDDLVEKIQTEVRMADGHVKAKQNIAISGYHGVFYSVWGVCS